MGDTTVDLTTLQSYLGAVPVSASPAGDRLIVRLDPDKVYIVRHLGRASGAIETTVQTMVKMGWSLVYSEVQLALVQPNPAVQGAEFGTSNIGYEWLSAGDVFRTNRGISVLVFRALSGDAPMISVRAAMRYIAGWEG